MTPMRIAIIGGGPGGLMTAWLLEQRLSHRGDITLFEASPRLGGKIVTPQFKTAPVSYEAGAAELYDYSRLGEDPLRELVAELGLSTLPMSGEMVIMGEEILPTQEEAGQKWGKETEQALRRFRRQARSWISPAEYYESDWKQDNEDPLSSHTFQALLNRIPDPLARKYVEISVHSDVATEPSKTNAMYGLQNYLMNEPEYLQLYSIVGGIERLPQELAKRLSAKILLEQPVIRVERKSPTQLRIISRKAENTLSEDFDFVVVALPNNWIPAIEWGGEVLATAMRKHHQHYDHPAHYLRVSILFKEPFWRDQIRESYFMLDAFGGCCVYDESSRSQGITHGVLGWLVAGNAAVNLSNFDDATLIEKMLDSLPKILAGGREAFLEGKVHRWVGSVNGLPGGFPAREPESRHLPEPTEHSDLFVVGDYLFDSTLNGVLDSAEVVGDWIQEKIEEQDRLATSTMPLGHQAAIPKSTETGSALQPQNGNLPMASSREKAKR